MSRAFAIGPGDRGSILCRVIPKVQIMVLDSDLLNTQHYKVKIKGKVESSPTPRCRGGRYGFQLHFRSGVKNSLGVNSIIIEIMCLSICNGEVSVMLELWGTRSISSLQSLPGPHWLGVVAPKRVLSRSQIELNCVPSSLKWNCFLTLKLCPYAKLNCLK